jgi:hypothetical protein
LLLTASLQIVYLPTIDLSTKLHESFWPLIEPPGQKQHELQAIRDAEHLDRLPGRQGNVRGKRRESPIRTKSLSERWSMHGGEENPHTPVQHCEEQRALDGADAP